MGESKQDRDQPRRKFTWAVGAVQIVNLAALAMVVVWSGQAASEMAGSQGSGVGGQGPGVRDQWSAIAEPGPRVGESEPQAPPVVGNDPPVTAADVAKILNADPIHSDTDVVAPTNETPTIPTPTFETPPTAVAPSVVVVQPVVPSTPRVDLPLIVLPEPENTLIATREPTLPVATTPIATAARAEPAHVVAIPIIVLEAPAETTEPVATTVPKQTEAPRETEPSSAPKSIEAPTKTEAETIAKARPPEPTETPRTLPLTTKPVAPEPPSDPPSDDLTVSAPTTGHQSPATPTDPPQRAAVFNPPKTGVTVGFIVNGQPTTLAPGAEFELPGGDCWVVDFDRGGDLGPARVIIYTGTHEFRVSKDGWELVERAPTE